MARPLDGVAVVEFAGLGPAPFCGMVLADMGADVIRIDRATEVVGKHTSATRHDFHNRGKRSIGIDLKNEDGSAVVLDLIERADVLIEGFRPGVAERLAVGPAQCLARNPALVFGRVTGWGQDGPYAASAGHDIDYIALSGALAAIGPADRPLPPLNLVGDFGGGGMLLAVGVLAALISARESGVGQIVDAAMVDGSALLTTSTHGLIAEGAWTTEREANFLDGGAPFYSIYPTSDGRHVAVGAIEPQFFAALLAGLDIDADSISPQNDRTGWPEMRRRFTDIFGRRTRDEWEKHFMGHDACVAPVLTMSEAPEHFHNKERGTFIGGPDAVQPAPAPRFSSTRTGTPSDPSYPGRDTEHILVALGYSSERIGMLRKFGAVA